MALPITVPYTFGTATTAIPLTNLDSDFSTVYNAVNGLGNGSVSLANVSITGGTVSGNTTFSNVTISSVASTFPNNYLSNSSVTVGNTSVALGSTVTSFGNVTLTNTTISSVASTFPNNYLSNSSVTIGNTAVALGSSVSTLGNVTLTNATISSVSTAITPAEGGTGLTSITANNVILGNGTSSVQIVSPGTSGNVLTSNGTTWISQAGGSAATPTSLGTVYGSTVSSGSYTTALGYQALNSNGNNYNVGIGYQALYTNNNGGYMAAVGYQALYSNSGNSGSVALGYQAGYSAACDNSIFIGNIAGYNTTGGNYNTYIGFRVRGSSATDTDNLVIAGGYNGGGAVGKGSSTAFITGNGGNTYNGANTSSFATTSDQRLKKNIVDNTVGLANIIQLRVRNFEYRLPEEVDSSLKPTDAITKSGVQLGFIAQELAEVLPDCVKTESTGVMSVNIDNVTYHMVNAIKELNTLITTQAATITSMQATITALQAKVGV